MTVFSELLNDYLEENYSAEWLNIHKLKLRNKDRSDTEAAKQDQLVMLYKGITGCDYSVLPGSSGLQATDMLILLLLHFRYMNAEQVRMLFPLYSGNLLKAYKNRVSKSGSPYFSSVTCSGKSCVYTLTQDVYDLYLSYFPSEYIGQTGIIPFSKVSRSSTLNHDVSMCDIPYGCLSQGFTEPMRWLCYCPLRAGRTPMESAGMYLDCERKGIPYLQTEDIVPDAIMLFERSGVLIEQDMCTERMNLIMKKFSAYGEYFSSFEGSFDDVTLLFNISLSYSVANTQPSRRAVLKNISTVSDLLGSRSLQAVYSELMEKNNGRKRSYSNMVELIEEFAPTEHDRFVRSLDELEEYVSEKNLEAEKADKEHYGKRLAGRVNDIRTAFRNFLDGNSPAANAFSRAMYKGLSFVVTYDFRKYCRYFGLSESGMMQRFLEKISRRFHRTSLMPYIKNGFRLTTGQVEYVFRNCVLFRQPDRKNYPLIYIIQEITFDIAGRYRMADFLKSYGRSDLENHCLLIVKDERDAVDFCRETGCINKFCIEEQVFTPNPAFNLTIRFCSMDNDRYFIMNTTEHIYYLEEI